MNRSIQLWAIGVGSVIGGDFFGWSPLLSGGIICALISFFLMLTMYGFLARCVGRLVTFQAEMKGKTEGSGSGADCFVLLGLGPSLASLTTALEVVKLNSVVAALALGIVSYLNSFATLSISVAIVVAFCFYFMFCLTNMLLGTSLSSTVQCIVTTSCLLLLLFYWISLVTKASFRHYAWNDSDHHVVEFKSFTLSFPFAAWLFLGFEEIPTLHLEEDNRNAIPSNSSGSSGSSSSSSDNKNSTNDRIAADSRLEITPTDLSGKISQDHPSRSNNADLEMNRGVVLSFVTVGLAGFLTVILSSSSWPGIDDLSSDASPLIAGLKGVYGSHSWVVKLCNILVVAALICPYNAFLLFASHHFANLAKRSVLPQWLGLEYSLIGSWCQKDIASPTTLKAENGGSSAIIGNNSVEKRSKNDAPVNALALTAVVGIILTATLIGSFGIMESGEILISASLFPAMISYLLQLGSLQQLQRSSRRAVSVLELVKVIVAELIVLLALVCLVYSSAIKFSRMVGIVLSSGLTIVLLGVFNLTQPRGVVTKSSSVDRSFNGLLEQHKLLGSVEHHPLHK